MPIYTPELTSRRGVTGQQTYRLDKSRDVQMLDSQFLRLGAPTPQKKRKKDNQ